MAKVRVVPVTVTPPPRFPALGLAILVVVTLLAYSPALRGPELFDDPESISLNPSITTLWPLSVPLHPPMLTSMAGRPVTNVTLALNYGLNDLLGLDQSAGTANTDRMIGYHLVNILLHVACGLLLLGIIRRTLRTGRFGDRWVRDADMVALFVTAVWLLHPLQSEAVNYLSQRTELLMSLCYLATLYASIRAWEANRAGGDTRWYVTGIVACLVGMGSKEVMVTAPLIIPLYDRAFRFASWRDLRAPEMRNRRRFYAGLFGTLALLYLLVSTSHRSLNLGATTTWYEYLFSQGWAILQYLRLTFLPTRLSLDYGFHAIPFWRCVPGLLVVALLGAGTLSGWTRCKELAWLAFAGTWFFFLLAPSSSVISVGTEIAAERRIYLALAGLLVVLLVAGDAAVRWFVSDDARRATAMGRIWSRLAGIRHVRRNAAVTLVGVLAVLTFARSRLYADPVAIWRDAAMKHPANARAKNNLGVVLEALPVPARQEADSLFRAAIATDSSYATPWYNLAASEVELGHSADAIPIMRRYVSLAPDDRAAAASLANLLINHGEAAAALPHLEKASDSLPDAARLVNLGQGYLAAGHDSAAADAFQRAIAADSTRIDALRYLGGMLIEHGHAEQAIPLLQRAAQDRSTGVNLALLSLAYANSGKSSEAISAADHAVKLGTPNAPVLFFAGRAMLSAKRLDLAEIYLTRALTLDPNNSDAMGELGAVREKQGRRAEAADLYRRTMQIDPGNTKAKEGMVRVGPGSR